MRQRPPAYAWAWLQRSRPVLAEVAERLLGTGPPSGFVDDLRARYDEDAFTRDVVIGTIADVAFGGRVPERRPAAATWDRGLIWWAAALAGTSPQAYEARSDAGVEQRRLFPGEHDNGAEQTTQRHGELSLPPRPLDTVARDAAVTRLSARSPERAALVARLRDLLARVDGDQVPASAVRDLIAELE